MKYLILALLLSCKIYSQDINFTLGVTLISYKPVQDVTIYGQDIMLGLELNYNFDQFTLSSSINYLKFQAKGGGYIKKDSYISQEISFKYKVNPFGIGIFTGYISNGESHFLIGLEINQSINNFIIFNKLSFSNVFETKKQFLILGIKYNLK